MSVEAAAAASKHLKASMLGLRCCLVSTYIAQAQAQAKKERSDVTLALAVGDGKKNRIHDRNLNRMPNGLNDAIENTCPFYFKRPPMEKAFVYDTSSDWPVPSIAQVLRDAPDQ